MQSLVKHLPHYISLIGIFVAGFIGFYFFSYDKNFQVGVVVAMSLSYISWGIIHHTIHKDICLTIVLEYVAISILGMVMALSLIFRT